MKLYKLSQGSTFENLKHFIYITNEYGVPSVEFIDAFIEQFGKVILNGNFTLSQDNIKQLDRLWTGIVKDCEHNNVEYIERYGNLFYTILCQKAILKIKEDWEESEWKQLSIEDKLELLKQFILDFDKHIDEFIETDIVIDETKDIFKEEHHEDITKLIVEEKKIKIIYKKSLQYRQNPIVIYDDTNIIELYHSINDEDTCEYKYIVVKSNNKDAIGNEYIDINKLIKDICIEDINLLKYSNGAPIKDLIIKIDNIYEESK